MTKLIKRISAAILRRIYFRNPLNVFLGQKIFGNDSGLLSNLIGHLALKKDRRLSEKRFNFKSNNAGQFTEALEHFREKGWARLDNIDFGNVLTEIRSQFDVYCQTHPVPVSQRLEASTIGGSEYFFNLFPGVKAALTTQLQKFIEEYYHSYFKVLNVHLYRIFPVPEELSQNKRYRPYGATGCWHNDGATVESIKVFILIDEVTESNGPMHLIGADETKKIIRRKFYNFEHDGLPGSDFEDKANIVKFTGQAGTVLFANTNTCLHRASVPMVDKRRDMLVFYLTSSGVPLFADWEKHAKYEQSMGFSRLVGRSYSTNYETNLP